MRNTLNKSALAKKIHFLMYFVFVKRWFCFQIFLLRSYAALSLFPKSTVLKGEEACSMEISNYLWALYIFIEPVSDHRQPLSVTNYLTSWRLVDLIDVTLACKDASLKFVEIVTDPDVEMRIMLAKICCRFGSLGLVIKLNFCSDFEHKVWSRF